jgi:hypothetical protein
MVVAVLMTSCQGVCPRPITDFLIWIILGPYYRYSDTEGKETLASSCCRKHALSSCIQICSTIRGNISAQP